MKSPTTKKKTTKETPADGSAALNNGQLRTGFLSRASLVRLIERLTAKVLNSDPAAEILLHLPTPLSEEVSREIAFGLKIKPGSFYLCSNRRGGRGAIQCRTAGTLQRQHPYRRDLFIIARSSSMVGFISASPRQARRRETGAPALWQASISFNFKEIIESAERLSTDLKSPDSKVKPVAKWLRETADVLRSSPGHYDHTRAWSDLLVDLTIGIDQQRQASDGRLRWSELIATVQGAVGWELNTGKLFESVSDVMKSTFGFHYLEIQLLEQRGRDWEVTAVHHRNDTTYGGPLLTVILKPRAQGDIIRSRKPLLVDPNAAADILMNPQLIKFMQFKSGILVPLIHQRTPNGLLKLFSQAEDHYGAEDLTAMEAIGRILARSIENVKGHAMLRRMATVDGLTNLFNRRFFMEQLAREFKRAVRYHNTLTLIMLDIDHFKAYNDAYGHQKGDYILTTLGGILKACVREVDMIGRYGGEEFVILLPEANVEQGYIVAEKIRQVVESYPFKMPSRKAGANRVTVSFGISSLSEQVNTVSELVNRADMALYRAKRAGRNRCEIFV